MEAPVFSERVSLVVVPIYEHGEPPGGPKGSPGRYELVFVFATPGTDIFTRDVNFDLLRRSGDSLLKMGTQAISAARTEAGGEVVFAAIFQPNKHGRLARAKVELTAPDLDSAYETAYDFVMPYLSRLAYEQDVAIDVAGCVIKQLDTGVQRCIVNLLGKEHGVKITSGEFVSTVEERSLLSSYREGINSTNAFYSALCFAKVIEGVRRLRTRDDRASTRSGVSPALTSESMPASTSDLPAPYGAAWHEDEFTPFLAQSFEDIYDSGLREPIRNALSHIDPAGGTTLTADSQADYNTCQKHVFVLRFMAHSMLENQFTGRYFPGRSA